MLGENFDAQGKPFEPNSGLSRGDEAVRRINASLELLPKLLDDWESKHPEWHIEVLLWVLDRALVSLRGYIEAETEGEITWETPYVELHFPVDCVWANHSTAEEPAFHLETGKLSSDDIIEPDKMAQALSRLLVRHIEIVALQDWTNRTAFEKRGENHQPVASSEDIDRLDGISDRVEREKAGKVLFRSKAFGAGHIDYGDSIEGEEISEEVAEQLAAVEPPLIYLPLEIDGHKIRLITILEISPPIADADTKKAYFPIVVGLAIQADDGEEITEGWMEQPWACLSTWAEEDREAIWDVLHGLIKATLDELGPKTEPGMEEAIFTVNAEMKVKVPKGDAESRRRIIADSIARFAAQGEIVRMDVSQRGQRIPDPVAISRLHHLLDRVENARSSDEKGKSLESLVGELFSSVTCLTVEKRIKTETEEIDLWMTNDADSGPLFREGEVILAECKNWTGRCGKNEFGSLYLKMMNRGGRCSLGFLISWNGFAKTIPKEMLRGSRDSLLIVPLDGSFLRRAVTSGEFFTMLLDARKQALRI